MFTHLHNHSEYSLLDGLSSIRGMIKKAKQLKMNALALTDHGGLYASIEFYSECIAAGIKPIIGTEIYMAYSSMHTKNNNEKSPYHLLLLAKNLEGYQNLLKLSSQSHLEGFYYKPRVDKDLLKAHSSGLIALSGCPSAEIPKLLQQGLLDDARQAALWYKDTFDDFYLELQRHENIPGLTNLNQQLLNLSKDTDIQLVATNDCHYIDQADAPYQDILICIHTNTNIQDSNRLQMSDDSYYLKSSEEMEQLFSDVPEAIRNTQNIVDQCDLQLDFSTLRLPEYETPAGLTSTQYLGQLCNQGILKRYGAPSEELSSRLAYELEVIKTTQFDNYMLVVWDIAKFTRDNSILFGVRGSAAASLVLYCLEVTDIDPVKYKLVFERFLNVERHEMPDIDMDFQDDRREEVIEYVRQKYGPDHVAQIITFGTLGPKAAIRDTGRALGMTYSDVDRMAKLIPNGTSNIPEALSTTPEMKELYDTEASYTQLIDTATHMEGVVRHASTHAAGVVITKEPLVNYLPLQRPVRSGHSENMAMTQFPMEPIAKLGLLKMDFLGLTNLTILCETKELLLTRRGIEIILNNIPINDNKTFALLSSGETTGVFQLEGSGMRRYIQQLKPNSLSDVSAMIALYRPGPMEHINTFINAKHGISAIRYPHPTLKNILEETYGVIVYQDQVLLIAQAFAGYSLGEADVVRKAMGKKIPAVMRDERTKFLEGAGKRGFTQDLAEEVFQLIEPFAGYAFNKAHSISYAMIAYWTAYFKANFPEEFMAAVMNAHTGQSEKISIDVTECLRLGIPVLLPDINRSEARFSIDEMPDGGNGIRFGLSAVKNIGGAGINPLIQERKSNGKYKSIEDLCRRANLSSLNKRGLESLIKSGATDSLGERGTLLNSVDTILSLAQRETKLRESGQTTMFDLFGESVSKPMEKLQLGQVPISKKEKLGFEKEMLGAFISENPASILAYQNPKNMIIARDNIEPGMNGNKITVVGQVASSRTGVTKEGKPFAAISLELLGGNIEVMVWSNSYDRTNNLWYEGSLVEIAGKVRVRNDSLSITCDEAKTYIIDYDEPKKPDAITQLSSNFPDQILSGEQNLTKKDNGNLGTGSSEPELWIQLEESESPGHDEYTLREVLKTLMNYPGNNQVGLRIKSDGKMVIGTVPFANVAYCSSLHKELADIVGENGVTLENAK